MDPDRRAKVVGLLGLGLRARSVVVGVDLVKGAVKNGKAKLVFVAPDASAHSRDKLVPLLQARRTAWYDALDAHALGAALGRETVAAVGVTDAALAKGIRQVLEAGAATARDGDGTRRSG